MKNEKGEIKKMNYKLINQMDSDLSILEQVLTNRGIELENINHFLNVTESDLIEPGTIAYLKDGVKMLLSHLKQLDNIYIQIDSDCDGISSSAILINYLYQRFPQIVSNHVFYGFHSGKQHGINIDLIPKNNIKLVIAPDSSSNNYEVHKILKEQGIDVLVIDHHDAEMVSPNACVINNQLCDYPTKTLSGAGMVYKFCQYIDEGFPKEDRIIEQYMDLAALGIIADIMSITDYETRYIVQQGLNNIHNPLIAELINKNSFSMKGDVNPTTVAWYIAPYINAISRSATEEEKNIVFKAMLDHEAYKEVPSTKKGATGQMETIVTQAARVCTNVKRRQKTVRDNYIDFLMKKIQSEKLDENQVIVITIEEADDQISNLTGLVANQLSAHYQRPTILLIKTKEGYQGSARGYDQGDLKDFKTFCANSNLAMYAEGHPNAFGIGFKDMFEVTSFIKYCNNQLSSYSSEPSYLVDFIYNTDNMQSLKKDILTISDLKDIWSKGIEEPLIVIENIKVNLVNCKLMGKTTNPTLKIELSNGVSLIKFGSSKEEHELLCPKDGCSYITIVGTCNINEWQGNRYPQVMIKDFTIVNTIEFDF